MSYDPLRLWPYAPIMGPLPVPGVAPDEGDLITVCLNPAYVPYVLGALEVYRWEDAWNVSGAAATQAIGHFQQLMWMLMAAWCNESGDDNVQIRQNPSDTSQLQLSTDGGTTWTDVARFLPVDDAAPTPASVDSAGDLRVHGDIVAQFPDGSSSLTAGFNQVGGSSRTTFRWRANTSIGAQRPALDILAQWLQPDASRVSLADFRLHSHALNNATVITVSADTETKLSFHGAPATGKPTIVGDLQGNAGAQALVQALASYGLVADATTLGSTPSGGTPYDNYPPPTSPDNPDSLSPSDALRCGIAYAIANDIREKWIASYEYLGANALASVGSLAIGIIALLIPEPSSSVGAASLFVSFVIAALSVEPALEIDDFTDELRDSIAEFLYCLIGDDAVVTNSVFEALVGQLEASALVGSAIEPVVAAQIKATTYEVLRGRAYSAPLVNPSGCTGFDCGDDGWERTWLFNVGDGGWTEDTRDNSGWAATYTGTSWTDDLDLSIARTIARSGTITSVEIDFVGNEIIFGHGPAVAAAAGNVTQWFNDYIRGTASINTSVAWNIAAGDAMLLLRYPPQAVTTVTRIKLSGPGDDPFD